MLIRPTYFSGANANKPTIFTNQEKVTIKSEPRPEVRPDPGLIVDPHVSLYKRLDSTEVKVVCHSPIPEGHIFGPISPLDLVHSGHRNLTCSTLNVGYRIWIRIGLILTVYGR